MLAKAAKFGAVIGVTLALVLSPLRDRLQTQRPSLLFAVAYFQAMLGNTESAVNMARQAAKSESGTAVLSCSTPCLF